MWEAEENALFADAIVGAWPKMLQRANRESAHCPFSLSPPFKIWFLDFSQASPMRAQWQRTLCRVPLYFIPGLPSPTSIHGPPRPASPLLRAPCAPVVFPAASPAALVVMALRLLTRKVAAPSNVDHFINDMAYWVSAALSDFALVCGEGERAGRDAAG
ncbi:unnamed protein product [Closterium sp. NIES-53]